MIRTRQKLDRVAAWAARGLLASSARRRQQDAWPERWNIVLGALLLGALARTVFSTRVPNFENLPPEAAFGFLGLYFYAVGFLSGRRTGQIGTGSWAGVASGLAFGVVVCAEMFTTALRDGVRETIRYGAPDQVAIALSGLGFFILIGALCGTLGARGAAQARRQRN
jgi:hypothetical protein